MSNLVRFTSAAVAVGVATTLAVAPATAAHQAAPRASHHGHHVLASGLVSPLRAVVRPDGTAYVSENFVGKIDRISPQGKKRTIYTEPHGYEVGGLSLAGRHLMFTVTQSDQTTHENSGSWLKVLTRHGHARTIADLHRYEVQHNPDQKAAYGLADLDPANPTDAACLAKWPTADNGPAASMGGVDSHPYATYTLRNGWTYVADAGGNDVLMVSPKGRIRTVATLPPIPLVITAPAAAGMGLDPCFVGATYYFEPVPTDVEVGPDGTVYVSSLPGGPEGPQLGARGSIFAIHGVHHPKLRTKPVVRGLLGPTGVAVTARGDLYVAQLFGDVVSKVMLGRHGKARVKDVIHATGPAEVEWSPRGLYITRKALAESGGDLVRYRR
ncbi:MAG: ScyD/ScyE family protein [Nocardioides sp.]